MSKKVLQSGILILTAAAVALYAIPVTAEEAHPPLPGELVCPLQSQTGRTLLNFGTSGGLRSDLDQANATAGPFGTAIPAGTYKVTLVSYDNHSEKPQQHQPHEQWYLSLENSQSDPVTTTNSTSDLSDDMNSLTEVVNTNLIVAEEVAQVTAHHTVYPDGSNPNSINAVCAAFDLLSEPTPTPSPSPTPTPTPTPESSSEPEVSGTGGDGEGSVGIAVSKTDNRETVRVGQTLTYTIVVENTGEQDFNEVTIKDTVPANLTIKSVSGGGTVNGKTVTWSNRGLSGGEKLTVTITATVKSGTTPGHVLSNTVTARSEDKGPSASDTDTTVVERNPQVAAAIDEQPTEELPVPITAATGANVNISALLAALTAASSITLLALRRWWAY